ncbi:MAG: sodium-dependent transporter [Bacteroidales bacterium]|nr:sodium-dependent transporter [Bacteroidales bacterium]
MNERAVFVTRFGGVLAAVGSAVGLGNVWRFPYETGAHGGAAFLLVYLSCALLLGVPLLLGELALGYVSHKNPTGTYRSLAPGTKWHYLGYAGAICMVLIVAFYSVVGGWTLCYAASSLMGNVPDFADFSSGVWAPLAWMTLFFVVNAVILLGGVAKGIERASNFLMPLLFLMLVVLCVRSLSLPNAVEGLRFLFKPDFSKIDGSVVVSAMGQSFFSISVGIGCLLTYGSYLPRTAKIGKSALAIALLDTGIALLAGIIIFPACFAYGVQPDAGPGLAFITLPNVFMQMSGGMIWCFCFFLLLAVAAVTSSLSLLETPTAILQEEFGMGRRRAVIVASCLGWVLSVLCAMSFCPQFSDALSFGGMSVFDIFDKFTANIIMPCSSFLMAVFIGWKLDKRVFADHGITHRADGTKKWYGTLFIIAMRFVAPLCIFLIFLSGLGLLDRFLK